METAPTDVPRSYRVKRAVPPYQPARTPYVGRTIPMYQDMPVVVIREAHGTCATKAGRYWVAPLLPDCTIGPMFVQTLTASDLITRRES